jgi:hypothetical protein
MNFRFFSRWMAALLLLIGIGPLLSAQMLPEGNIQEPDRFHSDVTARFSYAFPSEISFGDQGLGDIDTLEHRIEYMGRIRARPDLEWLAGAEWRRYGFGLPAGAPLPNTLHQLSLGLGLRWEISEKWQLRAEVEPGLYSDLEDLDGDDVNSQFLVMASYRTNPNLQWHFGLIADPFAEVPVFPLIGVNWKFAADWALILELPRPRIEYTVRNNLVVYGVADGRGGAFRLAEDFGQTHGRADLDDSIVEYREIRVGAGVRFPIFKRISTSLEGGWMVDRRFKFDDQNLQYNGDGAPYCHLGLFASF